MSDQPLFVVHHHKTCPGVIGRLANTQFGGYSTIFAPHNDLPNPHTLQQPVVVFGGNMSSNDPHEWLHAELKWLEVLLERRHPVFGICLGAQLLAKVLGEHVGPCANGTLECGYLELDRDCASLPSHAYQWHKEGFTGKRFDSDVIVHARSEWNNTTCQAFSHHNAWGVQFHPEITQERIAYLIDQLKDDINHPSARPVDTHEKDHHIYGSSVRAWLQTQLMRQWTGE